MVGVPGKYKGCNTCRARRVRCDNQRPSCRKCIDSSRVCGGYERPTTFIIGTIEDGGRCSSHPPRVVKSSKKGKAKKEDDRLELVPAEPLQPAWDDLISLSNFDKKHLVQIAALHTNLQAVLRDTDNDGGEGGGKFTFSSLPTYETPHVQQFQSDESFQLRSQALVHLSSPIDETQEEAIATTESVCLFLYQHNSSIFFSNLPPWKDPTIQHDTIRRLGPENFRTFPNHHFFVRVYRPSQIATALVNRTPSYLAEPQWITTPWELHPKSALDRLFDIMVYLPNMLARADRIVAQDPTLARRLMAQDLLNNCLSLERQLDDWYASAGSAFWISEPDVANMGAQMPFADTFAFPDGAAAAMFIYYWMALLLFYPSVERLYWIILDPLLLDDDAAGMMPPPPPPMALQSDPLKYGHVRELAANICRSLDFALAATVQPDLLAVPLFVVRQFYQHVGLGLHAAGDEMMGDGGVEVMWCEAFRERLAAKGRDILEVVGEKQWQDLASY
ncbi:hypothetical protein B0T22DRAFT_291714 [Podospora appendiculata]|uniref:Zn(2)-C6 fungal-type domain-containing protein n=1 Tax=Podospora appendiculata TaxID=314037 RepID=A0AAE0X1G3_9PEZI|nr:hypothetical protein B0T22DRAFT_291714 [Podospora appendiculata]